MNQTDIKRNQAEEELRASSAFYIGLLESIPDAILVVNSDGYIIQINKQTEVLFGYSREELLGQSVELLVPERFREVHVRHRAKYHSEPPTRSMNTRFDLYARRKDGSQVPVDISLSPLKTDGGLLVVSAIRDITERKRAEEVQREHTQLTILQDINMAATSTLDLGAVLNLLLDKINILLPYAASGVNLFNKETGKLERLAVRHPDEEALKEAIEKSGGGLGRIVFEKKSPLNIRNIQTDSRLPRMTEFFIKYGLVSYLGLPLIAKGEVLGVLALLTEEEHEFSDEEIGFLSILVGQAAMAIRNAELFEQTKKQAAELDKANRVKDEFLGFVSHELKTPLHAVIAYTAMLRDKWLGGEANPEQEKTLEKITSSSNELLGMINSLLEVSRIEAGGVEVERREVSLSCFLDDLRSAYEVPLGKELTLNWDYPSNLPVMETDGEKLRHILQNLINNAIKYTEKGYVKISARSLPEEKRAEFKIADTGIGIPKESLPTIFEMFRQVDGFRSGPTGGVGLGLHIVKKFTELIGGQIDVESEPGKGSTFTVTIAEIQE